MISQQYPSQLLERAVTEFSRLPGIGRKTALRLVLWMLRQDNADVERFADAVSRLKQEVKYCHVCHNISDSDICSAASSLPWTALVPLTLRSSRSWSVWPREMSRRSFLHSVRRWRATPPTSTFTGSSPLPASR